MTAGAAAVAALANLAGAGIAAAGPQPVGQGGSALGARIREDMAARDARERAQARNLDLREQAEKALAARLDPPQSAATPGTVPPPTAADARAARLARIYQSMKPQRAAPVFAALALDLQVAVARQMKERAVGAIMQAMDPAKAATLSMALADRMPRAAGRRLARTP